MPAAGSENYLLIASGHTRHAPFLAGWQEFKDHLRKIVQYQPGWTEVIDSRLGGMQGWCRLDRKDDAEAAYGQYARTRGILVHLFKTSRSNGDYGLLKCNCSSHFPNVTERGHSPNRSGLDPAGVNQYVSRASRAPASQYVVPTSSAYSYSAYPQVTTYATPPAQSYYGAQMPQTTSPYLPVYSMGSGGIPVNVRGGAMLTEARGIFLSNLSYQIRPNDLNDLLNTVGRPVESKLHRDSRSGQFKGSATAKFATQQEAQYAATQLNGKLHMGQTILVRLDTEKTIVGEVQAPVIVNGSNVS